MQINIQSKDVNGWRGGGSSGFLDFFSDQDWTTSDGEIIKGDSKRAYKSISCVITGEVFSIPLITTVPSTTDSPDDPSATWTIKRRVGAKEYDTWMAGVKIPHTIINPSWGAIRIFNNPPGPQPPDPGISFNGVALLIQELISQIPGTVIDSGTVTLPMDDSVLIPSAHVGVNSVIEVLSASNDITGRLYDFDRIPGISFRAASENRTETGLIAWFIRAA